MGEMIALKGLDTLATQRYQPDSYFIKTRGHAMLQSIFYILHLEIIPCLTVHTTMGI